MADSLSLASNHCRMLAGDPFPVDTSVVWLATTQQWVLSYKSPHTPVKLFLCSCGYALVCLPDENCLVADNVLQIIAKYAQDNILRDNPPAEVLLTCFCLTMFTVSLSSTDSIEARKDGCHCTPVSTKWTGRMLPCSVLLWCQYLTHIHCWVVFKPKGPGIYGKLVGGNWQIWQTVSYSPKFTDTPKACQIYTDCSLFDKFFLVNSFYLYGLPKFSPTKYFPCTVTIVMLFLQLLFMNHKLVKQYEKQLDSTLTGKH